MLHEKPLYVLCTFLAISFFNLKFLTESAGPVKRSEFGEHCNETFKCNKHSWLTCRKDNVCDCAFAEEMVFDPTTTKCVSKAGERCKYGIDDTIYQKSDCVAYANCSQDGVCRCDLFYYEIANGTCKAQAIIGEPCVDDSTCRPDKHLKCLNLTCGCDQDVSEATLDGDGYCVGLAEKDCLTQRCTPNATCQPFSKTCVCLEGHYRDDQGRCHARKPHLETCTGSFECQAFLTCLNSSCICNPDTNVSLEGCTDTVIVYGGDSITGAVLAQACAEVVHPPVTSTGNKLYITMKTDGSVTKRGFKGRVSLSTVAPRPRIPECVGLADNTCSPTGNCVHNAECANASACVCKAGYSATSKGHCGVSFDAECDQAENICSDAFVCTEGKCNCHHPNHQIANGDQCVSIISGPCTTSSDCIQGAQCALDSMTNLGFCQCREGLVANPKGRCEVAHGESCTHGMDSCDTFAGLKCRNGLCKCPDESYHFEQVHRRCVGLVGSRCSDSEGNMDCVEGAECVPGVFGVCKCKAEFEMTIARFCSEVA